MCQLQLMILTDYSCVVSLGLIVATVLMLLTSSVSAACMSHIWTGHKICLLFGRLISVTLRCVTDITLCLKKRTNLETVYLKIVRINFDDIWLKYSKGCIE